jgi:hypothetical protein
VSAGHGSPPLHSSWSTVRVRVDVPWPHVTEHAPKPKRGGSDHCRDHTQYTVSHAYYKIRGNTSERVSTYIGRDHAVELDAVGTLLCVVGSIVRQGLLRGGGGQCGDESKSGERFHSADERTCAQPTTGTTEQWSGRVRGARTCVQPTTWITVGNVGENGVAGRCLRRLGAMEHGTGVTAVIRGRNFAPAAPTPCTASSGPLPAGRATALSRLLLSRSLQR